MKNTIKKITCFTFIAAALIAAPAISRADDSTNTPPAKHHASKKPHGLPFHGKVASVDSAAMTFTVGTMTIGITSATKISKDAKPALFADITAGEQVRGSYKKDAEGKMTAASVMIGAPKKKEKAAEASSTAASGK